MAKAALEMGVLDAELRAQGRSFAASSAPCHERVPCGVSVGIMDSIPALLDAVGGYLDEGYVRIKLKIEPGWDVEPVRAVRDGTATTCCSRSTRTRRTRSPTPATSPSSTRSTCC
jgi:O-succinylbenzoate synthase